jgi:hypothetical protein
MWGPGTASNVELLGYGELVAELNDSDDGDCKHGWRKK